MVGFGLYERYVATEPMVPGTLFSNWDLRLSFLQTVLHGMILWSLLYYMPLYYEAVKGFSPILSGVAIFPETFTVAPASIVVGIIVSITGRYRWGLWSGWVLTTLGLGLLNLMSPEITTVAWIFINLVVGLGTGLLFPAMGIAVQAAVPAVDIAFAVAFYSFFRAFGQGLGVAVGGTIFQNEIKKQILSYPLIAPMADVWSADATGLVAIIHNMAEGDAKSQLVHAYADALKMVWIVMCALAAVGGISSLFIKGYTIDQVHETAQGFDHGKAMGDVEAGAEKPATPSA